MNPYDKHLPTEELPETKNKLEVGQVYTMRWHTVGPYVYRVMKRIENPRYSPPYDLDFEIEILATRSASTFGYKLGEIIKVGSSSTFAICSKLVEDRKPEPVSTTDWSKHLPKEALPDTGAKEFKTGQVWASFTYPGGESVYEILDPDPNGNWNAKTLAGTEVWSWLHPNSVRAGCSVLIRDVPASPADLTWEGLTDTQQADLISAASRAREEAIDDYQPRSGKPLNTLPAITSAVVRAFAEIAAERK